MGPAAGAVDRGYRKHLKDVTIHVSLTHEADTAAAVAFLRRRRFPSVQGVGSRFALEINVSAC